MARQRPINKKGTHVSHFKKPAPNPNPRLVKLREILGKSRPEFAKLVGVPSHTIRSYERGDRRLPEQIAGRIFYATFISPDWLLDDTASAEEPRGFGGAQYTLDFYRKHGISDGPLVDVDGDSSLAIVYMRASHGVARLLRVALRSRKHLLCSYLLEETISKFTKELRLADSFQKEMPSALPDDGTRTMMMGGDFVEPGTGFNPDTFNAALVLSSAMLFQWSAAVEGTEADRAKVLANLNSVKALILKSFEQRAPSKPRTAAVKPPRKT